MPPSRKSVAPSRSARRFLLAACAALPAACWGARPVPVFQVDVAAQTPPALQQAMREALVRATGREQAATDPAFADLVTNASKYVVGYQRGPQGETQVIFNSAAVGQAIAAAGRNLWNPVRPFTLIVISPPSAAADQTGDDAQLEQAAESRGLPISIVPLPVTDGSGNLLPRGALLELAHRYGADELLIGRPLGPSGALPSATGGPRSPAAPAGTAPVSAATLPSQQWQWTLETNFISQTWSGSLTTGIDQTVNLLAPPSGPAAAAAQEVQIEIDGVTDLADYANIELMLAAVPGVSAANVHEVDGTRVVFDLMARGGEAAVARSLAASPRFSPAGGSGALPVFRYRAD